MDARMQDDDWTWEDLFDGELHELVPGEDFIPADKAAEGQPPLSKSAIVGANVAEGWSSTAICLNKIAKALGSQNQFPAYQVGKTCLFLYNGKTRPIK